MKEYALEKAFFSSSISKGTKFCIILYIPLYCLWNWIILFSTYEDISVFWRSTHDTRLNWNWTKKKKKLFFIHFRFRSVFLKLTFLGSSRCRDYEIDFLWIWFYLHEKCDFSYFFSNRFMKKWVTFRKKYYDLYSCGTLACVVLCNRMRNERNDKNSYFDLYNTGRNIFW